MLLRYLSTFKFDLIYKIIFLLQFK
jgi:hypothetical protein